jgi:hypothetical protein
VDLINKKVWGLLPPYFFKLCSFLKDCCYQLLGRNQANAWFFTLLWKLLRINKPMGQINLSQKAYLFSKDDLKATKFTKRAFKKNEAIPVSPPKCPFL